MKNVFVSIVAVSAVLVSSAAFAGGGKHHGPGAFFDRFDTNQDGRITQAEARAAGAAHFAELDANKDGVLTPSEAAQGGQRMMQRHAEERFTAKDANKDGRLSKEEAQMPEARFAKLDANQDGFITKEEFQSAKAKKAEKHAKFAARMFQKVDTDGNGKLSRAEAQAHTDALFQRLDANGDKVVTKEELKAAHGHWGKRHGGSERGQGGDQR
jgi:Ca2+-binding EF-hand superfamily protein